MSFSVYILRSLKTNTYYYGSTGDIQKRLKLHNAGKVRYTKSRRPWILHYSEAFQTRSEAYRREMFFKRYDGHLFLKSNGII